jgi:hypothetical protein
MVGASYSDTPSIVHDEIATVRPGLRLRYAELTGLEKRDYLFESGIRATAYGDEASRPEIVGGLVQFSKSALQSIANHLLSQTLTRIGDELPEPKVKLFHTFGTTAKIIFVPEENTPYSDILAERVPGLARFSFAGPVRGVGVVPGLALKFPIDGDSPSRNLVAMAKLDRQQPLWRFFSTHSHNSVFQNPFTNILPLPSIVNLTMRIVNRRFETVAMPGYGLHQSLASFAKVRASGEPVSPDRIAAPYRVIFRPTAQARAASDPTLDFRDDLARNIAPGTAIYDVLGLDESKEKELRAKGIGAVEDLVAHAGKIGTIATESQFIASTYGDYRLFFKHDEMFIREEFRKAPANPSPS